MDALRNLSIKWKLMWLAMLTSGTALLLLYAGFVAYEIVAFPTVIARKLSIQVQMIGANSVSALLFSDPSAAAETMTALRADPAVVAAGIYDREGRAFAKYLRADQADASGLPELLADQSEGHRLENGHLVLRQRILADGEPLGTIYLQADLRELYQRVERYAGITLIALLVSFLVAALVAFRLQRGISRPILHLAETASAVSVNKDYSVRAAAEGDNELGQLVTALNGMLEQIQRRDAELAASESRHRALMEQANDAILILDLPHRVIEANREAERLLGLPREQILGRHYDDFVVAEERADSARRQAEFLSQGAARVESRRLRRADGTAVPVELSASVVHVGGPSEEMAVLLILRDVSERRRTERARHEAELRLQESEEQYRLLFQSNPHPMWVFDTETLAFLAVNEAAVGHYGYTREEFLGRTIADIRPPEDVGELRSAIRRREAGNEVHEAAFFRHRKKDGKVIEVDIASNPIRFQGREARLVLAQDVTERRSLEAQLLQAQKMESLGRLAGGVAHDFNNLLGIIIGYAELLRERLPDDPRLRQHTDDILQAAGRATGLTRQLLAFSRRQVLQPRNLSLNEVVRESEKMLRRLIGEDILLETRLEEGLLPVRADAGQLEQVVMNLAVNARDAMPRGGRLLLETGLLELDDDYARVHPGVQPGLYASLAVSDNGHGMPPEVLANIFEPFFTTKEAGKGTGLGLPTVHGIVRQSGGDVFVYSEVGRGTTFRICLPAVREAVPEATPQAAEADLPRGSETVLVVEDEPALGDIVRQGLEALGYTVLLAPQAEAALEISRRHPGSIELLITDVVMPGLGGSQLAQRLAASRPETKALFMSGFTDDAVLLHGVLSESMAFLGKPFTATALARKVRAVLDGT